jgi:uncharacterized protein with HEPN domain
MSAQRDDWVYIRHIRDAAQRIVTYVGGIREVDFLEAPLVQDGVIRQLQVIGEAAKRLSPGFRSRSTRIPWSDITGMRDKLVHDYMGVDLEAVWDTATRDVPELLAELEALEWPEGGSSRA